jgi:arylsulfatase
VNKLVKNMKSKLIFILIFFAVMFYIQAVEKIAGLRPNIILILSDDQGYGDFSCHHNPILKTPNLDRLYNEGRRFTDFLVSPTCSPTRAAIMTGKHEFKSGVTHTIYERERLSLKAKTLAEILKSAGYRTGIFGKWHLGDEERYRPERRGFDEVFVHGGGGIGQTYPGSCGDAPNNSYFNPTIYHNGKFVRTKGYCTDVFFNRAMEWIGEVKGRRPFFAYITPNVPHPPLDCPPEYEAIYGGKVPGNVAKFFGMIANLDENVGRLLNKLAEWGIERDTLVIYMNDNGGTAGVKIYNAQMRGQKGSAYFGGTRAASFWRWKGVLEPGDIGRLAAHVDILPTLAEIAGAKIPSKLASELDGKSLVPLLLNPTTEWEDRYLFTHVGRWKTGESDKAKYANCSVRFGKYHLVSSSTKSGRWELYDVSVDTMESNDLSDKMPQLVRQMSEAYERWWESVQAGILINEYAVGPTINPFKALYWKQFGGQPDLKLLEKMNPKKKFE